MAYPYLIPKSNHLTFKLSITHVQNYFFNNINNYSPAHERTLPCPDRNASDPTYLPLNDIGLLMFGIFGNFQWYNLCIFNLYHGSMAAKSRRNCASDRSLPSVYMHETVMSSHGPEYSRYFYWFKFILRCRDI